MKRIIPIIFVCSAIGAGPPLMRDVSVNKAGDVLKCEIKSSQAHWEDSGGNSYTYNRWYINIFINDTVIAQDSFNRRLPPYEVMPSKDKLLAFLHSVDPVAQQFQPVKDFVVVLSTNSSGDVLWLEVLRRNEMRLSIDAEEIKTMRISNESADALARWLSKT